MRRAFSGRRILVSGFSALAIVAASAARSQPVEQIDVVGNGAATSPSGTTLLGGAEINRSGPSTLGPLLDQLPAFGSQGVNGAQNDGGFGEYFVDLRNLNFDRTLVLVDGNRFVLSGIQTDEAVDLNNIPAAFVDHVEVLRDGTEPKYAADAVAGVVNVVLKDQIDGLRLDSYGGAAGAGDAGTSEISLVGGHGFEGGHAAFGVDAVWRAPLLQSDRDWAADPIASATRDGIVFGSAAAAGGHAVGTGIDALALGGGRSVPFDQTADGYNAAASRYLAGGMQHGTVYFDADKILTDSVSANVELLFTDRRAATLLPPQTLGLTGTDKHPEGFVIPASDLFNPFGVPVALERVVTEAGAQRTTTSGPVWRLLSGLDGDVGGWNWTVSFDHGQSLSRYLTSNEINLTRALQTAGALPCLVGDGCVMADWFGPGSLSRKAIAYISYTGRSQSAYSEWVGQARIGGPIFPLQGGSARVTVGAEARREYGATSVDAVTARGDQAGTDAAPTAGGYESYDAYATLDLPLLRGRSYARRLDFTLAGRATATTRYGAFGTLRAVMDYAPVEGVHFRAVSGTARRPPAISEAFGGVAANPAPVVDPCSRTSGLRSNAVVDANCRAQNLGPDFVQASPLIDVLSGGNPDLRPEQSENEMLGLDFAPAAWRGVSANVDWYHYRIRDAIDSLADTDPNLIPDACYESVRLSSPLCALITRIPGGGDAGQIGSILGRDENVGTIKTEGLEFGVAASREMAGGRLRVDWQSNWLLDFRLHDTGVAGFTEYAGTFPGLAGVGSFSRVRSRIVAGWECGPYVFEWTGRYISGARVLGTGAADLFIKAPGIFYQSVSLTRRFGRITALAGVDNLADTRPPTLVDGETNTSTSTYDVVGRFVWGRLSYSF